MTAEAPWDDTFEAFMYNEFLRNALSPYVPRDQNAIRTIPKLELANHVALVPSFLFRSDDDDAADAELQEVPARIAMICNGDLCIQ
jgi:hypothetical protein